MIEIIKPGTKEKISCKSCGCLFSYEKEDIEIGHPHNLYPLATEKELDDFMKYRGSLMGKE